MPPADPTDAFLAAIGSAQLLTAQQYADISGWVAEYRPDPSTLAKELTRRGWLTGYQVKEIYKGRAKDLVVGPYIVQDLLGEGGMGRVFKAHHTRLGRDVALKVIRKEKLSNPVTVQRFHQEVRAAAQLQHPNVVLAFDADEADGMHFFSMELVDGTDLTKLVRQNGPMPIEIGCDAIRQGALGLQHAFERGLVHRDIKPSNLIMTPRRQVKLLDLGLALLNDPGFAGGANANRVTQDGFVLGTPDFLAPEQAQNPAGVDIRADIYGLGSTLFYLLTGRVPFDGANPTEKLLKHITDPPPSLLQYVPTAPPQLDAIIKWLMSKRPEDRPQTPAQVAQALAPFCPPQSGAVPMPVFGGPAQQQQQQHYQQPPAGVPQPMPVPAYSAPAPAAALPVAVYPHAMPLPAPPPPTTANDAFAGFNPFSEPDDEDDRPRKRRRRDEDDDDDDRPRRRRERDGGGVRVRAPETRSSAMNYILLGGGGLALIGLIVVAVIYLAAGDGPSSERPYEPQFAIALGANKDVACDMMLISPGRFRMGSDPAEDRRNGNEGPAREVTMTRHFYVSATEITREQYNTLMDEPTALLDKRVIGEGASTGRVPNEGATWDNAVEFCKKLTARADRMSDKEKEKMGWRRGWKYRLPTEAEWEYACRAGTTTPFSFGPTLMMEKHAIFKVDADDPYGVEKPDPHRRKLRPYPIAPRTPIPNDILADLYREPNPWGLIDTHGSMREWCLDNYAPSYPEGAATDPTGPPKPDKANWKVVRGGSWQMQAADCRSASRMGEAASSRKDDIGFRIVYAPPPPKE